MGSIKSSSYRCANVALLGSVFCSLNWPNLSVSPFSQKLSHKNAIKREIPPYFGSFFLSFFVFDSKKTPGAIVQITLYVSECKFHLRMSPKIISNFYICICKESIVIKKSTLISTFEKEITFYILECNLYVMFLHLPESKRSLCKISISICTLM